MTSQTPLGAARAVIILAQCAFIASVSTVTLGCGSSNFYDGAYKPTYTKEDREAVKDAVANGTQTIRDAAAAGRAGETATAVVKDSTAASPTTGRQEPAKAAVPNSDSTRLPTANPSALPGSEPLPRIPSSGNSPRGPTRIMVYATTTALGAINVVVDDLVQGGLIHAFSSQPQCGAEGTITVPVRPGEHKLHAVAAGQRASWGPVLRTVSQGDCYVWRLDSGGSPPIASAPPTRSSSGIVTLGIWTRREENLYVEIDGKWIGPLPTYFLPGEPDCTRVEVNTTRVRGGSQVRISVRRESFSPVIFSTTITLPQEGCYRYELR